MANKHTLVCTCGHCGCQYDDHINFDKDGEIVGRDVADLCEDADSEGCPSCRKAIEDAHDAEIEASIDAMEAGMRPSEILATVTLAGHKRELDIEILSFLQKRIIEEREHIARRQLFENRPTICGEDDAYNEATHDISDYREYIKSRRNDIIRQFMEADDSDTRPFTITMEECGIGKYDRITGDDIDANEFFGDFSKICYEVEDAKKDDMLTCAKCCDRLICKYVDDPYNTDGNCLADK